jgi:hypothetical protein
MFSFPPTPLVPGVFFLLLGLLCKVNKKNIEEVMLVETEKGAIRKKKIQQGRQ